MMARSEVSELAVMPALASILWEGTAQRTHQMVDAVASGKAVIQGGLASREHATARRIGAGPQARGRDHESTQSYRREERVRSDVS